MPTTFRPQARRWCGSAWPGPAGTAARAVALAVMLLAAGATLADGLAWARSAAETAAAAGAPKGTALVVEPTIIGLLPPPGAVALTDSVNRALRELQLDLVGPAELAAVITGEPQLKDCGSELCFERLGRLLASQLVLRYRIKVSQPEGQKHPDWHLNVELLDVEVGAFGARLTQDCQGCSSAKAEAQLAGMVKAAVLQSAAMPRGVLELRTEPAGAIVFVDGTELGITPYQRSIFVGQHKIVVRHTGYRSQQLEASISEGKKQRLELKLVPGSSAESVVVVERERSPAYKKWWFWVAIGGGVLAAGAITAGIVLGTRGAAGPALPANTLTFP